MSDNDRLELALQRFEQELRAVGATVGDNFRPGLNPVEIRRLLQAEHIDVPPDAITWWSWHDGLDIGHNILIDPWEFVPLDVFLAQIRRTNAFLEGGGEPDLALKGHVSLLRGPQNTELLMATGTSAPAIYLREWDVGPSFQHVDESLAGVVEAFILALHSPVMELQHGTLYIIETNELPEHLSRYFPY